jgi:Rrf2 family protein
MDLKLYDGLRSGKAASAQHGTKQTISLECGVHGALQEVQAFGDTRMISRTSEYAVRSLSYMASRPRGEFLLALDMARELGIPAAFLGKVLQPLVLRGLLTSQRGRGGGFRLAKAPEAITLLAIVQALDQEEQAAADGCGPQSPADGACCVVHAEKRRHQREFRDFLERTTLAEMATSSAQTSQNAADRRT